MLGPVNANAAALTAYGQDMASVSDRISKAFREDSNVDVATEFAKASLIEHGTSANLKLIRVEEDMMNAVLDIIA